MKAPCYMCFDRKLNCHSSCFLYKEFQNKNNERLKQSRLESEMRDYTYSQITK